MAIEISRYLIENSEVITSKQYNYIGYYLTLEVKVKNTFLVLKLLSIITLLEHK